MEALSEADAVLLNATEQEAKWRLWEQCIEVNACFIDALLQDDALFANQMGSEEEKRERASGHQMEKVCGTLRQVMREWTAEGAAEREAAFTPLLDALKYLPQGSRVLCPGAGLGRLVFEVCSRGYAAQGNEWSFFMLLCGHYLLNRVQQVEQHVLYPFIHHTSNVHTIADMFRPVCVPDVLASSLPPGADFSFSAGGFEEVYGTEDEAGRWDGVLTCFFLDTARNVLAYVRAMHALLRPGGLWANVGPLLYHYAELVHERSLELSGHELMAAVRAVGFDVLEERTVPCSYTRDKRSLMHTHFDCMYFRARKR